MPQRLLATSLLLLILACATAAKPGLPRGVDPALAGQYLDPASFSCLDPSTALGKPHVNDEYCDCLDGSDEPGTSACPNGRFYCRNRGHTPLTLNASFVDDGFCDCCDGSDEPPERCPNTCREAGAAARQALKDLAAQYAKGAKVREKYVREAASAQAKWAAELQKLEADIEKESPLEAELRAKKEAIDKEEQVERERADAARAAAKAKAAKEAPPPEPQPAAESDPAATPDAQDPAPEASAEAPEGAPDADQGGEVTPAVDEPIVGAEVPLKGQPTSGHLEESETRAEKSAEEIARERMSQWIHSDDMAAVKQEAAKLDAPADSENADAGEEPEDVQEEELEDIIAASELADRPAEPAEPAAKPSGLKGVVASITGWLKAKLQRAPTPADLEGPDPVIVAERQKVKDAFHAVSTRVADLQRQKTELATKLGHNFGPDGVFQPFLGKCFEANVDKYTYVICPYKDAAQKDGGLSTSLGTWAGFQEDYANMVYSNGQGCWQGPARSLTVDIVCGASEQLAKVSEPNRCEYIAELATPAACSADKAAWLQQQVESAEKELRDEL